MNIRGDNKSMVELSSLTGLTTKEMNWKALRLFSLTFEPNGLSARSVVERPAK